MKSKTRKRQPKPPLSRPHAHPPVTAQPHCRVRRRRPWGPNFRSRNGMTQPRRVSPTLRITIDDTSRSRRLRRPSNRTQPSSCLGRNRVLTDVCASPGDFPRSAGPRSALRDRASCLARRSARCSKPAEYPQSPRDPRRVRPSLRKARPVTTASECRAPSRKRTARTQECQVEAAAPKDLCALPTLDGRPNHKLVADKPVDVRPPPPPAAALPHDPKATHPRRALQQSRLRRTFHRASSMGRKRL